MGLAVLARLDPDNKLTVHEPLSTMVQHDGIDGVSKGVAHARCDEHILESIGIQITDRESPRPVILDTDVVGYLLELAVTQILVEAVAIQELTLPGLQHPGLELLSLHWTLLRHV